RAVTSEALATGEEVDPANTDRQRRGLHVLSQGPPVHRAAFESVLSLSAGNVRKSGGIGPAVCARLRRNRRLRFFPAPSLPSGEHRDRGHSSHECKGTGSG